jgi:glycosyltransferase involved in cell wall biosynthesis
MPSRAPSAAPRRPLTVLQLIPTLETGGAERATLDIAAALVRRGDRALVASEGGRLAAELAAAGGRLIKLPVATKNPVRLALLALRLVRLIRAEKVDIVHARSRAPAWAARLACRRTGTPLVTTFHGIYGERNAIKRRYNSVMAQGDVVIANSQYTARLIMERHGTPAERIAVIPRGVDLARFSRVAVGEERRRALRRDWGLEGGERLVLNLARLTGWKGQKVLAEAAALPPLAGRDDVVVVLAGDAQGRFQYRRELEQSIATRDLTGRVRIVGHCDDAPAALALADVAVIASIEPEAFGRTAIEAAAMGVPAVATALGATVETVLAPPRCSPAKRTGWLVPPGQPAALAEAIDAALSLSPAERHALAARARENAMRFTTEAMQDATLAVYDRLAVAER